jgi:hypothetical protein
MSSIDGDGWCGGSWNMDMDYPLATNGLVLTTNDGCVVVVGLLTLATYWLPMSMIKLPMMGGGE